MTVSVESILKDESSLVNFMLKAEKELSESDVWFLNDIIEMYKDVEAVKPKKSKLKDRKMYTRELEVSIEKEQISRTLITWLKHHHPTWIIDYEFKYNFA